ncbi:MAG: polyphosphate polymerase domain-containing protein [Bacteroides sp.]|nr:polyphosphate polymerase domain-containing protein [Bacteroides sp.]
MTLDKENLLTAFSPITLEEMSTIRLMNRIDTKFILSPENLHELLRLAVSDYRVQEVTGERDIAYHTVYLDTPTRNMYLEHLRGHSVREKIRVRTYVSSHLTFLEIKNKNNKGRTDKKRIRVSSIDHLAEEGGEDFLRQHAWYELGQLSPQLENHFHRITLVNKARTERLTIDCNINFRNTRNANEASLDNLAVVELKRDGRTHSPIRDILRDLHVHPSSFSKYCMGCVLTDNELKQNRFKPRTRMAIKINGEPGHTFV